MYSHLKHKLTQKQIHGIIREAVGIEQVGAQWGTHSHAIQEYLAESLPVDMIGMNCTLMKRYIEFVADHLLAELNVEKVRVDEGNVSLVQVYNVTNPFDFMENLSIEGKTNFFEKKVSEYQRPGVLATEEQRQFNLEADF